MTSTKREALPTVTATDRNSTQSRLGFLNLPAEIRIKIYKYLFVLDAPFAAKDLNIIRNTFWGLRCFIVEQPRSIGGRKSQAADEEDEDDEDDEDFGKPDKARGLSAQLLRTNKRIAAEGAEILYGNNRFVARDMNEVETGLRQRIGTRNAARVRDLEFGYCCSKGSAKGESVTNRNAQVARILGDFPGLRVLGLNGLMPIQVVGGGGFAGTEIQRPRFPDFNAVVFVAKRVPRLGVVLRRAEGQNGEERVVFAAQGWYTAGEKEMPFDVNAEQRRYRDAVVDKARRTRWDFYYW